MKKIKKKISSSKFAASSFGFSLVEMLISLAIFTGILIFIGKFEVNVFTYNDIFYGGSDVGFNSLTVLQPMVGEIRSMSPSSLGAFPIDTAGTSTLIFYNDINNNGLKERIRYFISGTTMKRGMIIPTGSPLSYATSSETITTLATNVVNSSSTPIFTYYDSNYNGIASSTEPEVQPVTPFSVTLVRVTLVIDNNTNQPLAPVTVTSVAMIRTLKGNY